MCSNEPSMLFSNYPASSYLSERRHRTQPAIEVQELAKTLDKVMIFGGYFFQDLASYQPSYQVLVDCLGSYSTKIVEGVHLSSFNANPFSSQTTLLRISGHL